jgi:D-beta-D-heptose 7-phosphate kinase/D-beta-D-heptose 1-phosphate adenosyltransferase
VTASQLQPYLEAFRSKRVLVIGDVMLDRFLWGNVSRISPEAPVPIVHVTRESAYPGGAANVARNLAPFASKVHLLGITGADSHSKQLAELLEETGIDTSGIIQDPAQETIVKTRVISRSQHVVRIDRERLQPASEATWDKIWAWLDPKLGELDAIILEDYAKGLITQEFVDQLAAKLHGHQIILTVDPNPSNPIHWKGATAIKPNRKEAFAAARMADPGDVSETDLLARLPALAERLFSEWEAQLLLITLGEHGMALLENAPTAGAAPYHTPTRAREVFDVSGAGDTAIALFTLALAAGATGAVAAEISNIASGIVVGKIGTATVTPAELLAAVRD